MWRYTRYEASEAAGILGTRRARRQVFGAQRVEGRVQVGARAPVCRNIWVASSHQGFPLFVLPSMRE